MFNPLTQRLIQSLPVAESVCELGAQTWKKPDGQNASAEEFYKRLGWKRYAAIDISKAWGALPIDLNIPPNDGRGHDGLKDRFDLVTNNGTGEHLFNQDSVFQWMHDLAKPEGLMVHVLPWVGWLNHGFYNFQPVLFRDISEANGYRVEAIYCGERNGRLDRIDGDTEGFHRPRPDKEPWTKIEKIAKSYGERACIFVCAVLRKMTDAPFKVPVQGIYKSEMEGFKIKQCKLFDAHESLKATLYKEPYPYIIAENLLPADFYEHLAKTFPTFPWTETDTDIGNTLHQLSMDKALGLGVKPVTDIDKVWRKFFVDHSQSDWFMRLHEMFGDAMKPMMLKMKQGDLTVGVRNTGTFDIQIDMQVAINSPVKVKSRVRGPHVDSPDEMIAGLMYFPLNEDTAGGDLIHYKWRDGVDRHLVGKAEIRDEDVEEFARVPYQPNTAVFFVNGPDVIHGIDYREPTKHLRRYVNFIVNASKPVVEFPKRVQTADWKGIRRSHQR